MERENCSHQECMDALKNLALEIKDMDEKERLNTLEEIVRLETEGKGNRFWLLIVKCLLAKPESLPKAINLAEAELNPNSNIRYLPVNQSNLTQATDNFADDSALSTLKNLFV